MNGCCLLILYVKLLKNAYVVTFKFEGIGGEMEYTDMTP